MEKRPKKDALRDGASFTFSPHGPEIALIQGFEITETI